jgi:hypothetical protein
MARVVGTLEICDVMISSNAGGSEPLVVGKTPLVVSPSVTSSVIAVPPRDVVDCNKVVASRDGNALVTISDDGISGTGECLPKLPGGDAPVAAISHRDDPQTEYSSVPVENRFGNQVETEQKNSAQDKKGQNGSKNVNTLYTRSKNCKRTQVLGYVPIEIANLSLEEVELNKCMYVAVASPIRVNVSQVSKGYDVNPVLRDNDATPGNFENYLREKLTHLPMKDRRVLAPVLRQYKHFFYGMGSVELGSTSQVEHSIETGDARPIKSNPYRTPHALKPVLEEHIREMLQKRIIEPSISPWSSSIVLVQKKSKDGSVKYRFCVDYRALNAVTKPDAYPIPNIVDTLDSLGHSKVYDATNCSETTY